MKDIITSRLSRIKNLNERKLLRNVLLDVFENMVDYNMEMYDKLERRIYNEIEDSLDKFYIYTTLDEIHNIDPISDFLHPICPQDVKGDVYCMEELQQKFISERSEQICIATVFMQCDLLKFQEIIKSNRKFNGKITTDINTYEITVSLQKSLKYVNEIIRLYKIFQFNAVTWRTINCPFAYKYVDVILESTILLESNEKIKEIYIDLDEFEIYKRINYVPLWNIKLVKEQDKTFPMPSIDAVHYDHVISLVDEGTQNGYMVDINNKDFSYVKRYEHELIIVSQYTEHQEWNLIKIENIDNLHKKNFSYELLSNKRNLGFSGRFASLKSIVIHTTAELARLLHSYELSQSLQFQDVAIVENYQQQEQTRNLNDFIDDNIREDRHKKVMLIRFSSINNGDFLLLDKMSFFITEIQMLFPEYRCVGELI